jgi:hypothetical protein
MLTAFSVELFPTAHNIFAIGFFLSNVYPLLAIKRFRWYILLYLTSAIGLIWGILWAEIWGIVVLSAYHLHTLLYARSLMLKRENARV